MLYLKKRSEMAEENNNTNTNTKTNTKPRKDPNRRNKRKADVVRPGPLYKVVDSIVTIAGLALVGAIVVYVIMIFS